MNIEIQDLHRRFGADDLTLKPYLLKWDKMTLYLKQRGVEVDQLVELIKEDERVNSVDRSFGLHVLHKLDKAVTAISGEQEYLDQRMESVISDLEQIIDYSKSTSNTDRSFIGVANHQIKKP